jgi:hypothetical protein
LITQIGHSKSGRGLSRNISFRSGRKKVCKYILVKWNLRRNKISCTAATCGVSGFSLRCDSHTIYSHQMSYIFQSFYWMFLSYFLLFAYFRGTWFLTH